MDKLLEHPFWNYKQESFTSTKQPNLHLTTVFY